MTKETNWAHFVEAFSPNQADLDLIAEFIRSERVPCTTDVLLHYLLQHKLAEAQGRSGNLDIKQLPPGTVIYQQAGDYEVGQRIYIASRGQMAIVEDKQSEEYPTTPDGGRSTIRHPCKSIRVKLEDGTVPNRFICAAPFLRPTLPLSGAIGDLIEYHGKQLRDKLKNSLWYDTGRRFVSFDREWFLQDLLIANEDTAQEVRGLLLERSKPASVLEIAYALFEDVSDPVITFSLSVLLNSRSDLFQLTRRSPPPVLWSVCEDSTKVDKPERIAVPPVRRKITESDKVVKSEEPRKPRKKTKTQCRQRVEFAIPIGYRESGTIPLNSKTAGVFPSGLGNIPLVFIDARGNSRMQGGVSHEEEYAWGIFDWLEKYHIPSGGMIALERTDDEFELKIDYVPAARARPYSVRAVKWVNGKLVAYTRQITPECEVDLAMYEYSTIFEDPTAMWAEATDAIFDVICYIFPVLAEGDPDDAVHYKTISSAVSYIRRCAPSTVWALLSMHKGCFRQVEERPGFWRFDRGKVVGLEETEIVRNALLPKIMRLDSEIRTLQTKLSALKKQVRDQALRLQAMRVV